MALIDSSISTRLDAPLLVDAPGTGVTCNPLTQSGCTGVEKCTWISDQVTPVYVGHIGCAPAGAAFAGDSCVYGAPGPSGYDNCANGLVCSDSRGGTGACKSICDVQGGTPMCDASHACAAYADLFVFVTACSAPS